MRHHDPPFIAQFLIFFPLAWVLLATTTYKISISSNQYIELAPRIKNPRPTTRPPRVSPTPPPSPPTTSPSLRARPASCSSHPSPGARYYIAQRRSVVMVTAPASRGWLEEGLEEEGEGGGSRSGLDLPRSLRQGSRECSCVILVRVPITNEL